MLTMADLIAFSGLTEEEILAIAEHEHIPEAAACSLAEYLSQNSEGLQKVRDMIVDDIRHAQARSDRAHVRELLHVLHHFLRTHPQARPEIHPWSGLF
jgi:DNA repair protein RadC